MLRPLCAASMVSDSVRSRQLYVILADGIEEHEIVQRKELGSKPPTTYGYLESEDNAVSTIYNLVSRSDP
jgi:hypothetical protein